MAARTNRPTLQSVQLLAALAEGPPGSSHGGWGAGLSDGLGRQALGLGRRQRHPHAASWTTARPTRAAACKAFRREAFLALPYFDHMHRYLPALMLRDGHSVAFRPVGHRPRTTGASKYTNLGRLAAAVTDLAGVLWLRSRARDPGNIRET